MSLVPALRRVPLFAELSDAEIERVAELARERTYPKSSVILFEDDPGDALYVVVTGRVKVVLVGEDGREVILSVLKDGDFFGEMALIDDEPRSAHVIAMEDASLLVLRREDFQQRLREAPGMAVGLLRALSRRLGEGGGKIGGVLPLLRDTAGGGPGFFQCRRTSGRGPPRPGRWRRWWPPSSPRPAAQPSPRRHPPTHSRSADSAAKPTRGSFQP